MHQHTAALPSPIPLLKPGQRFTFHRTYGSADALAVASYLTEYRPQLPLLAVICASAADAQRLSMEIAYFAPDIRIRLLPDWETLPYDTFSPHQDLISERLATLHDLTDDRCDLILVPATTALYRMPPRSFMAAYTFEFTQKEKLNADKLKAQLTLAGYERVNQVLRPGEYCIRGGLIDLFPMGTALPYRIDLFDDQVASIRSFDPDTQRSLYPVQAVRLLPGRECPMDEVARTAFRRRWRETFEGDPSRTTIYKDISAGIPPAGIEYYLPLFFDETATLFDYLPTGTHLALVGDLETAIQQFTANTRERYAFLSHDRERPILEPKRLFLSAEDFFTLAKPFARLVLSAKPSAKSPKKSTNSHSNFTETTEVAETGGNGQSPANRTDSEKEAWAMPLPPLTIDRYTNTNEHDPLTRLRTYLIDTPHPPRRALIVAESAGRRETLAQLFSEYGLSPSIMVASFDEFYSLNSTDRARFAFALGVAPLAAGFAIPDVGLAIITENELYGALPGRSRMRQAQQKATDIGMMVRDLAELKPGDPIVHHQHGIGRYRGLITMDLGEGDAEFLHLDYAHNSQLYVPVDQLQLISRYSGVSADSAPLSTLGSGQWEKAKRRAAQQIHDTAAELLDLYARRRARTGHAFKLSARDYEQFVQSFGFEETPDQACAIEAVIADMTASRPMDRLVCGDVGFGKTEVALRAAFIAVLDGKQVALLSPTTLLAEQHFQTFSDRFAKWPVHIAEVSRFKSAKEIANTIQAINEGQVDIVIGTHQLLSSKIHFKQLGLVIVDEEHRFGVRQKEALKALRAEVDVLTLTATPIPRTLGMALEGLRDFSVIATAPQKRLAIKTFVRREENSTIREAVLRELKRGGQVYFLHNEVETIENRAASLKTLVPDARITIAHGQMHERELEGVMRDFVSQRTNMLLCTTIIETGIDVPNANTILIHRADKFGLAQLHQLRGRVGRSHHQAYAYLLINDPKMLTQQAARRLEAIQQMEELGAGFYLAMHDLEIRGAGQMLGDKQSGEMHEIGFQLYTDMLNEAVKALKAGESPDLSAPLAATTEIKLHVPAMLPADYCGNVQQRLSLYKRLANCDENSEMDEIQEELIDRFGKLPPQAVALIETHRLRIVAKPLGIIKMDASQTAVMLQFAPNPPIDSMQLIEVLQKYRPFKFIGEDKLRIEIPSADLSARVAMIKRILQEFNSSVTQHGQHACRTLC